MRTRMKLIAVLLLGALGLGAVYSLKRFYSRATADELGWILAPTAALVGPLTGARFEPVRGEGYVSWHDRFVIAPACAGVNFLLTAFSGLMLLWLRPRRSPLANLALMLLSTLAAFAATLAANTLRISFALLLHREAFSFGPLTAARLHRLEGIAVYLIVLLVLFSLARRLSSGVPRRWWAWLALSAYVVATVGVPLFNGGLSRPGFLEHAAVCLALAGIAGALVHTLNRRGTSSRPAAKGA